MALVDDSATFKHEVVEAGFRFRHFSPVMRTAQRDVRPRCGTMASGELHRARLGDALLGGEHDPQAADRGVHGMAEIGVLADSLEKRGVLPVAKSAVVRLVGDGDDLVLADEVLSSGFTSA